MSRFPALPRDPVARLRLLAVALAVTGAVLNVALFSFYGDFPTSIRWIGTIASLAIGGWWWLGYARRGFPTWGWLVDFALVTFITAESPMPLRAIGVLYVGMQLRALYMPRREIALLPVTYCSARLLSIALVPQTMSFGALSSTSVIQAIGLGVIGITLHVFVTVIERQQKIERALEQTAERYRLVAGATRDVVYDWNVPAGTIDWTESMEAVFGYAPQEIERAPAWWLDRVHADDRPGLERAVRDVLADSTTATGTVNYRVRRADGRYAHVSGSILVQRSADGAPARVIGSIRDVTTEQQLEEQLRQSQKLEAVGQLAGGVAHDFNNLLTVIGGHVFLLERALPREELLDRHLGGITRAAERAATLTKQLLAFSRKQILTPSVLNVNAVVEDVLQMIRPVIGEHIQIATRLDPLLSAVYADAGQLGQVLVNLALNARDAMPSGGTLSLETDNTTVARDDAALASAALAPGEYVRIVVRDTGIGMDAATLARAFEPFFTTKPQGQGSGLGLATVYGIVKQSFGDVHAASTPGAGASFTVLLPVAREAAVSAPGRRVSPAGDARIRSERTVLLVEDDDGVRAFASEVLSRAGYRVQSACNGVQAITQLDRGDWAIDLVVTDVVMPEMGGRELVEVLRERQPDLPALFITGYTSDAHRLGDLTSIDTRLLDKPFTADALAFAVADLMEIALTPSTSRSA